MDTKNQSGGGKDVRSTPTRGKPSDPRNEPLPGDFEEKARQRFDKLEEPELTFEPYLEYEKNEFYRQRALENDPSLRYQPIIGTKTPCGNGDFEQALDPAEWQGAYGSFTEPPPSPNPPGATINFGGLTAGILAGAITSSQAHQTWVPAGLDPIVGISTTAPSSAGAVRIGNAVVNRGCELLSKTFVVTPASSTINFWYAVVLEDPHHSPNHQPFFWVRVTDASGNIVPGAFDFGSGSDKLIADLTNPFFHKHGSIVYTDWSCAQIDLSMLIDPSTQVGSQVTIEFVTADCARGAHWGYAYIDNFCGDCCGSQTGCISYNCEASTHCGPGRICVDYSLPTVAGPAGPITGSVTITLDIYQNGNVVPLTQLTSPTLTSGSSYCFNINPTSIPGIDTNLGGFDFVATGVLAIGNTPLGHHMDGSPPHGITAGKNNDYLIACKTCEDIEREQDAYLSAKCGHKVNLLPRINCDCLDDGAEDSSDCRCTCHAIELPDIKPCISIRWGDSKCDCIETDDVEVLCVTVCNCYSNVAFNNLTIGHILITDMAGNPVPQLPDGTPSVQVFPSGPICFGDIGPCKENGRPNCVSRELVLYTRGAVGQDYLLSFEGVCFTVSLQSQSKQCFIVTLCRDE